MNDAPTIPSFNGTFEEVAAFFRRDRRTVERWVATGKLHCWRIGSEGNVVFGEQHVVDFWVKNSVEGLAPGEAKLRARNQWREHLGMRSAERGVRNEITKLKDRIDALSAEVQGLKSKVQSQHLEAAA